MKYEFEERFDSSLNTYRRVYSLDNGQLVDLSEFSDQDRKTIKYSIDFKKAYDSHYEIDLTNMAKLANRLHCSFQIDELVSALTVFFTMNTENQFVDLLNKSGIRYQPFHFYDYDFYDSLN